MAGVKKLPTPDRLREHVLAGMTKRQIGERYGVSAEAVRQTLKRADIDAPRETMDHSKYLPWRVRADHASDPIAKRLRLYSRQQQGMPLMDGDQKMLDEWIAFMEGKNPMGLRLSVHYDRTDREGFWLAPRQEGDRDYIHPPA